MANGDIRSTLLDARNAAKRHDGDSYMEKITPLKIMIREKARTEGVSLEDALDRVRQLQEPAGIDLMRWQAALAEALEDGEVIEEVPTLDTPRPTSRSKVPAWAKKLCDGGIRLEVPPLVVDDEYLQGMLIRKRFLDLSLAKERQEGVCEVGYALSTAFTNRAHWSFGKVVVFGWRVDERKVHKGTLEAETERRCRHLIANEGYTQISKNHRKELKEQAKADLLRNAVPQRTVYPVAWCPTEGWMLVQGSVKIADAIRKEFQARSFPLEGCLDRVVRHRLSMLGACTRLNICTGNAPNFSKTMGDYSLSGTVWTDLMLWLLIKADQAQLMLGDATVTWSPKKEIRVLSGGKITCPIDAGALVAALADGAIVEKLRLCITEQLPAPTPTEEGEDANGEIPLPVYWHLALTVKDNELEATASLAPVTKKDLGDEDPLEAMVFERVELHRRFWALLEKMLIAFADARCNVWPGVWESGREWVGIKLKEHYVFDEKTGQGWLFAPKGEK